MSRAGWNVTRIGRSRWFVNRAERYAHAFARQMPARVRNELFNTGIGLKEGDPDPHWQLVARSDDRNFKPRPAIVTRGWMDSSLSDNPDQSQWISLAGDLPDIPDDVTFTFRTTFDLAGTMPGTAVLNGQFAVDNHVRAIRLNGRDLPVPEHGYDPSRCFWNRFEITDGFVPGRNVLEIDVFNGDERSTPQTVSPMALLAEFAGSAMRHWREPPADPEIDPAKSRRRRSNDERPIETRSAR